MLPRSRFDEARSNGLRDLAIVVGVSVLLFALSSTGPGETLRDVAGSALRNASEPVAAVARFGVAVAQSAADSRSLSDQLAAALAERDHYAADAGRVASLEREISELQAALDLRSTTTFSTVPVQVVARDFAVGRRIVIIDAGLDAGIKVGDIVIGAGNTLVGRVISVEAAGAHVRLISDPAFAVTVEVASTGAIGLLHGRGASPLLLENVDAARALPIGAQVTTSGIELSPDVRSAFPRGLSVGRVAAVNTTTSSVLQSADIEPIITLDAVRTLLVIVNYRGGLPVPSLAP